MRIMHVLPTLTVGGAETLVSDYLVMLKQLGHEVALLVYIDSNTKIKEKLLNNGIPIYVISPASKSKIGCCIEITRRKILYKRIYWRIINNFQPDVLHFHLKVLPDIKDIERYNGIKLFYTYHSDINRYIKEYGQTWKNNICELSKKGYIHSFALSYKMLNQVKKNICEDNVIYLANGIDIKEARSKRYDRALFLKSIKKEQYSPIIVHVGRLAEVKNHKKSIEIVKEIINKKPNVLLLLVGMGDEAYTESLKQYAMDLGVSGNISFLGFRTDINEIISVCDAALLPSYFEGFPLTVLEYQAHGIRCVVSEAIPEEAICNNNCFRLSIDESNSTWCGYLLGTKINHISKDIMEFDSHRCITKMMNYYEEC